MDRKPVTLWGHEKLKLELEKLIKQDRPQISKAIAEARAMGDLKENAEYHAARERQSFIEGRIIELESAISNSQIIDTEKIPNTGKVVFGSTVTLRDSKTKEEISYTLVGEIEADISKHLISITSPIARTLIGKKVEQQFTFAETEFEVISIDFKSDQ